MLEFIEHIPLANLPTPLESAGRLARHLGVSQLLIKRDDLTGLGMGGNKARKLEYDLAPIVREGCDTVLTVGGVQSNHACMTAAAARRLGLDVKLVLGGPDVSEFQGNLLLHALYGAEIRYLVNDDENDHLEAAMQEWIVELKRGGARPAGIPIGGSTGLGAVGYVRAMEELAGQLDDPAVQIVLAVGSCGTLAGTIIGARRSLPGASVFGISVSRTAAAIVTRTGQLVDECCALLGTSPPADALRVNAFDAYVGEYGVPTLDGLEAIRIGARLEGLALDPVYTGKAMSGLIDLLRRGILDRARPIVFIHTGGLPILFAHERAFHDWLSFSRR